MSLTGPCSTADGRSPTVPPSPAQSRTSLSARLGTSPGPGTRFSLLLKPCCHSSGFSFP